MITDDQAPDPADFEQVGTSPEWRIRMTFAADIDLRVSAHDRDEAVRAAQRAVQELHCDSAEVQSVTLHRFEINEIWQREPLYRVTRGGRALQVSHLEPGDIPRPAAPSGW